jgi:PEP-CTERM motif
MTAKDAILRGAVAALTLTLAAASAANATEFELTLSGYFNGDGGTADALSGGPFAANTPFTITAVFDTSSPNLVAGLLPFSGFVSYAPRWVNLSVGGTTYSVATYTTSPLTGFAVDVFDQSQPFGANHYGIGVNQDPIHDGAGIVGDWLAATPDYTVASTPPRTPPPTPLPPLLASSTTYSDFFGVGFGSGTCSMPGVPPCITTPIPLDGGADSLYLGTYDLTSTPYINDPESPPGAFPTDLIFTATLTVVPEPSTWGMMMLGFAGLGFMGYRKARSGRTPPAAA